MIKEQSIREQYKFDYFTQDNYKKIIRLAIEEGFHFISFDDDFQERRRDILWRHDVEFSPDIALQMAETEYQHGVKATYFFQIHSEFYNIFNSYFTRILQDIKSMGHHIGLHFDSHYYNIKTSEELDHYIKLDKAYFEQVFDMELKVFSFHNTNPFILSCEDLKYSDLINVYSSFFKSHYQYCADSTGYWRYEILDEVLRDMSVNHLQVLTHDAMWSEYALSPRKRVHKSIQDNADRIKQRYDDFFAGNPAIKNIDD